MKHVHLILFFLPFIVALQCPTNDKCLCLKGNEFEFQCPKGENFEIIIHMTENKEISIDCMSHTLDVKQLPNVTLNKIDKLKLRFCPLPKNGFREILQHFSIKEVKMLQYQISNASEDVLSKDYFEGLGFLDILELNNNDMINLEEDVFANTPNITSLNLGKNKIHLKDRLFEYTPKMKSLDMSENQIESIPSNLFKDLSKLELLHLWSNNLKHIDEFTFRGLTSLRSLELSSNKIEQISENAFQSFLNLSRLNLSSNKLKDLPVNLFRNNPKMELIMIRNNENLKIPDYFLSNLTQLKQVDLRNCEMVSIPSHVFEDSVRIESIDLSANNLQQLPYDLFKNLENLERVNLSHNKMKRIGNVFGKLRHLKVLHLQDNQIRRITDDAFTDLISLEVIDLKRNKIEMLENHVFSNTNSLKKLDLSHNSYSGKQDAFFRLLENVPNLEEIYLSYNKIVQIDDVLVLYNKVNLNLLDLSNNQITSIDLKDLQPFVKKLTINLEHNNITFVNFALVNDVASGTIRDARSGNDFHTTIFLESNPLNCDCSNYNLLKYLHDDLPPQIKVMFDLKVDNVKCANPPRLRHLLMEDVPEKSIICTMKDIDPRIRCPDGCSCNYRPFDDSSIIDCSGRNLTDWLEMDLNQFAVFNQTELDLQDNYLTRGPSRNSTFDNVTKLFLSNNQIRNINWLPPKLKVLHLDNNNLTRLEYHILEFLNKSVDSLTLDRNPWKCNCDATNLTNFLRQNAKTVDASNIHCFDSSMLLIDLNDQNLCDDYTTYVVIGVLLLLLLISVLFAVYFNYQQPLKVWLYSRNLCLWWVTEEELDKDKIYDAFISYSHRDEDFVTQNLLPVLEGGPNPYKLCLHYRNWIPGEFIATQVTNSVLESRRTLVVLSPSFLESVWGKMEFRTAHTQAMTEGRARVIIVLYGEVDIEKLDNELKSYLKTNTYVKWGDQYFWNKLRYALPHSKRKMCNNNQRIANVMNCIDDKFNLVAPVTPSPGSTPPTLLDAEGLKKHPLNFVQAESGNLLDSTCL